MHNSIDERGCIAQMLVDNVVDYAIYLLDLNGIVKSWNAGAQRIKGYNSDEIIGSNFAVFYTDEDVRSGEPVRALEIARSAGKFETEGWRVRKDGTRLRANVVINSVSDESGDLIGFAKIVRDVSQRLEDQTALRETSEQLVVAVKRDRIAVAASAAKNRLMAMAEQLAHVGHWRIDVLTSTVTWSDEIYRIHGLPKSYCPELHQAFESYHPDDQQRVRHLLVDAIATGAPFTFEARIAHTDGRYRDVASSGQVERADDGQVSGVVGVFQDITERKSAEREREGLLERLALATRTAQVGIWDWDITTNAIVWDPMMYILYGLSDGEVSPRYEVWVRALHDDDRERVEGEIAQAAAGGSPYDTEFRVLWPNGEVHHIRAMGALVRDGSGSIKRIIGTNWDVTEVRTLAEQLRQEKQELLKTVDLWTAAKEAAEDTSRAKSDFLANMSHEIRTPMNGIIGLASLLLDSDLTSEQKLHVTLLSDAGRSLLAIINDILDLSKVEAGKITLEAIALSPASLIDGAMSIVRGEAMAKGIALDTTIASEVPSWVSGDPTRLRQILLNLLTNALKFTEQGRVEVTVRREAIDSDLLRFEISDTGIGIAADRQHLLFKSFSQVDRSTTRKYGGTGLGLAISRNLSEAMSGAMGVTSTLGTGSTFWFTALLPPATSPSLAHATNKTIVSTSRRILVVDDNAINQVVANGMLTKDGHYVVLAADGAEALAAVKASHFDLVLMDMQMPVMDGIEATRRIRALSSPAANVPIVALTANVMPQDVLICHNAGMNDYLAKPIDCELLRQAVARWATPRSEHERHTSMLDRSLGSENRVITSAASQLDMDTLLEVFDGDREAVAAILDAAIASIRMETRRIQTGVDAHDAGMVTEAAHRLKGTAGDLRANRLIDIASLIERTPDRGSWSVSTALLADLARASADLSVEIEAYTKQHFGGQVNALALAQVPVDKAARGPNSRYLR